MKILDNISNTINAIDNQSRELNDISNNHLIKSNRSKISETNNYNNILSSNQSNRKNKKKIKLENFKPCKFKSIMLLKDLKKANTFLKKKKFIDVDLFK